MKEDETEEGAKWARTKDVPTAKLEQAFTVLPGSLLPETQELIRKTTSEIHPLRWGVKKLSVLQYQVVIICILKGFNIASYQYN